jgi:hypothetical protein
VDAGVAIGGMSTKNLNRWTKGGLTAYVVAAQRVRLFEALGIIEVTRHALASKLTTLDGHSVIAPMDHP